MHQWEIFMLYSDDYSGVSKKASPLATLQKREETNSKKILFAHLYRTSILITIF